MRCVSSQDEWRDIDDYTNNCGLSGVCAGFASVALDFVLRCGRIAWIGVSDYERRHDAQMSIVWKFDVRGGEGGDRRVCRWDEGRVKGQLVMEIKRTKISFD